MDPEPDPALCMAQIQVAHRVICVLSPPCASPSSRRCFALSIPITRDWCSLHEQHSGPNKAVNAGGLKEACCRFHGSAEHVGIAPENVIVDRCIEQYCLSIGWDSNQMCAYSPPLPLIAHTTGPRGALRCSSGYSSLKRCFEIQYRTSEWIKSGEAWVIVQMFTGLQASGSCGLFNQ